MSANTSLAGIPPPAEIDKERGLSRQLNTRQIGMIGIAGALGIGFFLRSSLAIQLAGPAVILTYLAGACIAFLFMRALSEMAVVHPTAGSFGVYAELYVSRWAGFVVRYTYWASLVIGMAGQANAIAIYCQWWFPAIPAWVWILVFSAALIYANTFAVGNFGEFEFWLSMIKVLSLVFFILFGLTLLGGFGLRSAIGTQNFNLEGGLLPNGWAGAWLAIVFVISSFGGVEMIAVTAGEAKDPGRAVPRAMRAMVIQLTIAYLAAMTVLIGVVPWNQIQPGRDVTASPFVTVFRLTGIPAAAHVMNFVVLMAACSSMNCGFYVASRMLFSLARAGYAPRRFGKLSRRGTPLGALLVSASGLLLAAVLTKLSPGGAFIYLAGLTLFGLMFVWQMIFVTHLFFRRSWLVSGRSLPLRLFGYPYTTILGLALVTALLLSTWWIDRMQITLVAGASWLILISLAYGIWANAQRRSTAGVVEGTPEADPGT
jgi:AAT family amino acid transporter